MTGARPHGGTVVFLRPTLGIGGAERLVTDAAMALAHRGHRVTLIAPGALDGPQFPGLAERGVQLDSRGAWIPSDLAGRLRAPLAVARTTFAALHARRAAHPPAVVFCDVIPHVIPLARRLTGAPAIYYCHYPDLLMTPAGSRASFLYKVYRGPLDHAESRGIRTADLVLVNSRFTASIVRRTFPGVDDTRLRVVYPGVQVPECTPDPAERGTTITLLSLARFDPRKNLVLAVRALDALRRLVDRDTFRRVRLVLAGHLNRQLPEAVAEVEQLRQSAADAGLSEQVVFRFSPSEAERLALVASARCLVYTPEAEHFGYVPVEAMAARRPVIAVNHGGPTETVLHGLTGLLCEPTPAAMAEAMAVVVTNEDTAASMGAAGYDRARTHFSLERFGDELDGLVTGLYARHVTGRDGRARE